MSFHPRLRLKLVVIALTLLYSGLSKADNTFFPLHPRLNVSGGTGDNTYGAADVMAPLFGSSNAIFYADAEGKAGQESSWLGSLGFGERDALNNDLMLGGYFFVDRSKSNNSDGGNQWLVFNPGVELITNHWDGRINAYIPSGKRKDIEGSYFGDQVNRPDALTFSGHNQYSLIFSKIEEIGPGADIDAGYTFTNLKRFRLHGGGYYYNLNDTGDIDGIEAGADMPISNHITLQFNDSYDNVQKNTAVVSLRLTFGGIKQSTGELTVQDRILDPIHRHFGALYTNAGVPSHTKLISSHNTALERSNIWFFNAAGGAVFNPSAGENNCTFEHPCVGTGFNQSNIGTINNIAPGANFYFTPGTYTFAAPNNLNLNSGQSMYGRSADYALPASSTSGFPTFIGEIDPQGNNILDSFALLNNNGSQLYAIHVQNANNVLMNNLQIGNINNTQQSYSNSIQLDTANNITVQNSNIQSETAATNAAALTANNSSNVVFNTNINSITNTNTSSSTTGILLSNSSVIADNNTFTLKGAEGTDDNIFGLGLSGTSTLTAAANLFTISNADNVYGLLNTSGNATLIGNQFNLTSTNNGTTVGIRNIGGGNVNMAHNQFMLTSSGGTSDVIGIINIGSSLTSTSDHFDFFDLAGARLCQIGSFTNNGSTFTNCT